MRGHRRLPAVLVGAILALALCAPTGASASDGAQASIVGGSPATIDQFPYLAYIQAGTKNRGFSCTGTVVAPRVVLTAAHCVEDVETGNFSKPAEYTVATGVANPKRALLADNVFDVVAVHVFPTFDPGAVHGDAAVLILSRPTAAPPLALAGPAEAALYQGGAAVAVAGWGVTRAQNQQAPANMRTTTMTVQKAGTCRKQTKGFYPDYSPAVQLCLLATPKKTSGTCFGDSGGPAVATRPDGTPVELAIISVVGALCSPHTPNVLTRIDHVSTWVAEWIAATESGAPTPLVDPAAPLPEMTKTTGEEFAVFTLLRAMGNRFAAASRVGGSCKRASKTRFLCEIVWLRGGTIYVAAISSFYTRSHQTFAWDSHYLVRWAPRRCVDSDQLGKPGCKVHSQRG